MRKLRIAFDARLVYYQQAGIGQYILHLVQGLARLISPGEMSLGSSPYELWVLRSRRASPLQLPGWVRQVKLRTPSHHRFESRALSLELAGTRLALLHSPDFIPPFGGRFRSVITIHDLNFIHFPEFLTPESAVTMVRSIGPWRGPTTSSQIRTGPGRCNGATSRTPRKSHYSLPCGCTSLQAYNGPARDTASCCTLWLPSDFIIFVGTLEPRKNVPTLLKAFGSCAAGVTTSISLSWVVKAGSTKISSLHWLSSSSPTLCTFWTTCRTRIWRGCITPRAADTAIILTRASAYLPWRLWPAAHQSSSLTAALCLKWVGDAGLLVDPDSPEDLSAALAGLLDDTELSASLRQRGLVRSGEFSWAKAAHQTMAIYEQVLATASRRMRILFLTPQLPYPPQQGTAVRNYGLMRGLSERHQISLLSFCETGQMLTRETAGPLLTLCRNIETVPAPPPRSPRRRAWDTFTQRLPDMALRLASPVFVERLAAWLAHESFDVVHIEGIEMAPYLELLRSNRPDTRAQVYTRSSSRPAEAPNQEFGPPLIMFDDHNCEYMLQKSYARVDARIPRRWPGALYSLIQWQKLRRYEARVCRRADRVLAVSQSDAEALQRLVSGLKVTVIPNGIDTDWYLTGEARQVQASETDQPAHIGLCGQDGLSAQRRCRALVHRGDLAAHTNRGARVVFLAVGQRPHPQLDHLRADPSVTLTGWVEDPRPYIARATVYVAPLRMGSGTRLKLLEAMAMGKRSSAPG